MAPNKKMKMNTEAEETLTLPEKKRETLEEGEDRISNLPDSLLVHILSLLDSTQEAIKTGTLSKRWESVWTAIPKLVFDYYNVIYHSNSEFVSLVNKTIDQCRSCKDNLKTFKVNFMHHPVFVSDVKSWISFAVSRNVEELEFLMWDTFEFKLPQRIFINSSFTRLVLDGCILKPKREICWKALRDLHISGAFLDETLIENILSGSPLLETLEIIECRGYNQLNITSKSLKVLSVIGYGHLFAGKDAIEINAPNILSLEIGGDLLCQKPSLQNVSALVDAKLDYRIQETKEVEEELLKGLIHNLGHVKDLTVGVSCSKVVSRMRAKGFPFPSNMKFPVVMSQSDSDSDSLEDVDLTSSDSDTLEDGDLTSADGYSIDYGTSDGDSLEDEDWFGNGDSLRRRFL